MAENTISPAMWGQAKTRDYVMLGLLGALDRWQKKKEQREKEKEWERQAIMSLGMPSKIVAEKYPALAEALEEKRKAEERKQLYNIAEELIRRGLGVSGDLAKRLGISEVPPYVKPLTPIEEKESEIIDKWRSGLPLTSEEKKLIGIYLPPSAYERGDRRGEGVDRWAQWQEKERWKEVQAKQKAKEKKKVDLTYYETIAPLPIENLNIYQKRAKQQIEQQYPDDTKLINFRQRFAQYNAIVGKEKKTPDEQQYIESFQVLYPWVFDRSIPIPGWAVGYRRKPEVVSTPLPVSPIPKQEVKPAIPKSVPKPTLTSPPTPKAIAEVPKEIPPFEDAMADAIEAVKKAPMKKYVVYTRMIQLYPQKKNEIKKRLEL